MNKDYLKTRLAPCGLHCGKCFAFNEGDISYNSRKLKTDLGNFDVYAERFVSLLQAPVFSRYPAFKEMLAYLSEASCKGCRNERCKLFKNCKVRDCAEQMQVDFCFECSQFPCSQTGFDEHLHNRSVAINQRMKEIGVGAYYQEIKDLPRY